MPHSLCRIFLAGVRVYLALSFAGLLGVVSLQVVARHLFAAPPFWTEELARFLLIWLTFIGAVLVHQERGHISIDTFVALLPGRARQVADILVSLVVLATLVVLAKGGFDIAMMGTQTSPALGVSMRFIYMSLPIGACLMILLSVAQIVGQARALSRKGSGHGA